MRTAALISLLTCSLGAAACASSRGAGPVAPATADDPCRAPLPSAALAVPAGSDPAFSLLAIGVQIYTCTATPSGAAWVFTAPEAALSDGQGRAAGTHFAGPTWKASDGSTVVGTKVAGATPDPASIPWLLLSAASHDGGGRMERVTFIQRLRTSGGNPPASGCDAARVGTVARVPYGATYCFHQAK